MKTKHRHHKPHTFRWQAVTSTVSTMLVLVLMGLTVLCSLTAWQLGRSVKESLTVAVLLSDEVTDSAAVALRDELELQPWLGDLTYISREDALREHTEAMGTDPSEFLGGENPFTPSFEIHLLADYACTDSLLWISDALEKDTRVADVVYQRDLVERLGANLLRVTYVLAVLSALLLLVSLVLINNTVRLSVYSRRFLIHTMTLVGASWGFIRRPFMRRAMWIGLTAGLLASGIISALVYVMWGYDDSLRTYVPLEHLLLTDAVVLGGGLLLTLLCTLFSVERYLGMKEHELYN